MDKKEFHKQIGELLESLQNKQQKDLVNELYSKYITAKTYAEYWRMKFTGEWPSYQKTQFTEGEIKEWLSGWCLTDGRGNKNGALSLTSIISLLECPQDGIQAYYERNNRTILPVQESQ